MPKQVYGSESIKHKASTINVVLGFNFSGVIALGISEYLIAVTVLGGLVKTAGDD